MRRDDLPIGFEGWQLGDCTNTGPVHVIGPVPVKALREEVSSNFWSSDISQIQSIIRSEVSNERRERERRLIIVYINVDSISACDTYSFNHEQSTVHISTSPIKSNWYKDSDQFHRPTVQLDRHHIRLS